MTILTCKFWSCVEKEEEGRCTAPGEVFECGLGGTVAPLEWPFRKFWHCGLTAGVETCMKDTAILEEMCFTKVLLFSTAVILTCIWAMTLDGTFWYLGEVQRALTGTGRDCVLSASCSLQRFWISRSRRTFSLPKSCTRCSEGRRFSKFIDFLFTYFVSVLSEK